MLKMLETPSEQDNALSESIKKAIPETGIAFFEKRKIESNYGVSISGLAITAAPPARTNPMM